MAKYFEAPNSLDRGIRTVKDSLGEGQEFPVNASQAFEHLIPMTKFHIPTTKALAAHYNPLEGSICGLFMTKIVTTTGKTSCTHTG